MKEGAAFELPLLSPHGQAGCKRRLGDCQSAERGQDEALIQQALSAAAAGALLDGTVLNPGSRLRGDDPLVIEHFTPFIEADAADSE